MAISKSFSKGTFDRNILIVSAIRIVGCIEINGNVSPFGILNRYIFRQYNYPCLSQIGKRQK
jgi:hypothetical protein